MYLVSEWITRSARVVTDEGHGVAKVESTTSRQSRSAHDFGGGANVGDAQRIGGSFQPQHARVVAQSRSRVEVTAYPTGLTSIPSRVRVSARELGGAGIVGVADHQGDCPGLKCASVARHLPHAGGKGDSGLGLLKDGACVPVAGWWDCPSAYPTKGFSRPGYWPKPDFLVDHKGTRHHQARTMRRGEMGYFHHMQ